MDIDDYSRDRSPVRDRERSPVRDRSDRDDFASSNDSQGRRDYGGSGYSRSSYGDRRGGRSSYGDSRGSSYGSRATSSYSSGYRGGNSSRDYSSRGYTSRGGDDASYRSKTERNYDNSIFVGNIPFESTSRDIEDIFKGDFEIIRADIVTNRGRSRGMATVEFKTKNDVDRAIQKYDKFPYHGREIFVREDQPPPEKRDFGSGRSFDRGGRGSRYDDSYYGSGGARGGYGGDRGDRFQRSDYRPPLPPSTPGTEVFIGNLPFSINWQALKDIMRKAGSVVRADVRLDAQGRSRGFGTVVFDTAEEADAAVQMFQGYEIEGRKLDARPGRTAYGSTGDKATAFGSGGGGGFASASTGKKNSEFTEGVTGNGEEPNDTIYVENLPFSTENDDLFELFESIGRVAKAEVQYLEDGRASGNGVVQFELPESAATTLNELNGYEYGGRRLRISYKKL
ncbi:GBP2 [Candida theae]|uniref:GBP2 n=1 Tax=Candida theae TaxID=1198502 RepID=A0AAD5BJK8_9ASCO|nr:GBP2 [Candida theae]KAI5968621.1 GBP2 [Candida theae]